jgi:predicted nucleic acid-binding protein
MVVVIDANLVISATLTPRGLIADFIFSNSYKVQFIAPAFILAETKANEIRICAKNKMDISDFRQNLQFVLSKIMLIDDDEISDKIFKKAFDLTKTIDTKDTIYIALAISFDALFWAGDLKLLRGLKRKGFNQIITTLDFQQILKGL